MSVLPEMQNYRVRCMSEVTCGTWKFRTVMSMKKNYLTYDLSWVAEENFGTNGSYPKVEKHRIVNVSVISNFS
jgi:hypothetical protein